MAKSKFKHSENADGVCSKCGLEMEYLSLKGASKCAVADEEEAVEAPEAVESEPAESAEGPSADETGAEEGGATAHEDKEAGEYDKVDALVDAAEDEDAISGGGYLSDAVTTEDEADAAEAEEEAFA